VVVILALSACAASSSKPNVTVTDVQESPIVSTQTETLSPDEVRQIMDTSPDESYILGPSDVIAVQVYLHPELSVPPLSGTNVLSGALITGDGTVGLPLIGSIHLGGLTLNEAQQAITQAYAKNINNPNVNVQLVQAQSLRYYLLGAFTLPGVKYPLHPLNLLEALALGGSVDIANADLYQAYVAQGKIKLPVDLKALLVDGDLSQNITLASNDVIVIPSSASENAFVFGAVGKPGAIQFHSGELSLLQALSVASLDLPNYTAAGLSDVRIIRSQGRTGQFIVVNAMAILQGKAGSFDLVPGDIVFVPPTAIATWNQVLDMIIPSLQTVSDTLAPFVSIKYLTNPRN
jgi:polysaccharide export outer membrane protein